MARLKTRTREHVIGDLGENYVERVILLAGYTAEEPRRDYGIDLVMRTYSNVGEIEGGQVLFQVKATDHLAVAADGRSIAFRVGTIDLRSWLIEWDLTILALYDAVVDRAFWLDVHEYARANDLDEDAGGETVTLRFSIDNVLDNAALDAAAQGRDWVTPKPSGGRAMEATRWPTLAEALQYLRDLGFTQDQPKPGFVRSRHLEEGSRFIFRERDPNTPAREIELLDMRAQLTGRGFVSDDEFARFWHPYAVPSMELPQGTS